MYQIFHTYLRNICVKEPCIYEMYMCHYEMYMCHTFRTYWALSRVSFVYMAKDTRKRPLYVWNRICIYDIDIHTILAYINVNHALGQHATAICVYIYICMHVYTYVRIYLCTFIHIYTVLKYLVYTYLHWFEVS